MTTAKDRNHRDRRPRKSKRELELEDKLAECETALARLVAYGESPHKYWEKYYGVSSQARAVKALFGVL